MRVTSDFRNYYEIIKQIGVSSMANIYSAKLKKNNEKRELK